MNPSHTVDTPATPTRKVRVLAKTIAPFFAGLLLPLGFAPFHMPGVVFLGLALLYHSIRDRSPGKAMAAGFAFGLGCFGFGVSWIQISIHEYGHLGVLASTVITLIFVATLALFPALVCVLQACLARRFSHLLSTLVFASLWVLSEALRASFTVGFPWLLLGYSQMDTPLRYLLPVVGLYGTAWVTCLAAALLAEGLRFGQPARFRMIAASVLLIISPGVLKFHTWHRLSAEPVHAAIVQANLSMRDKWDEALFQDLMSYYESTIESLLGTGLIVLPESAIPLPESWIADILYRLDEKAKRAGSALLAGIPKPANPDESAFYNSLLGLGKARGSYQKQRLVPFGEYIPEPFSALSRWLNVPDANLKPGRHGQPLLRVHGMPVATLICYELAYGNILRSQLPHARWIVSVSDDGWFGKSLAPFQHLQMAQVRSIQSARYQIVANNDGLSTLLDPLGNPVNALPAFSEGVLRTSLWPATGITPWVLYGEAPALVVAMLLVGFAFVRRQTLAGRPKREYPFQP